MVAFNEVRISDAVVRQIVAKCFYEQLLAKLAVAQEHDMRRLARLRRVIRGRRIQNIRTAVLSVLFFALLVLVPFVL